MKVLFLHLSDAHLLCNTFIEDRIINAQVQALNSLGSFDKCSIIFSGDLAQAGQINEYKKCGFYLGRLWRRISDKYSMQYPVSTFVVPGNHDIDFGGKSRGRSEIAEMLSSPVTEEMIAEELKKFDNFYDFANNYHCFQYNKLVDVKQYTVGNQKIQINLINSELFSTCKDQFGDDDKGKHLLPQNEWCRLSRGADADLVLTVSHRGPEWFNWEDANNFKKQLYSSTDIFLYGHEHIDDLSEVCQADNHVIKSIAQGLDFKEKKISFTAILVDLDTNKAETTLFTWNEKEDFFTKVSNDEFQIEKNKNDQYLMEPSDEYVRGISFDDNKFELNKYFVFPGVEILNQEDHNEIKEFGEFLTLIDQHKQIIIEADESSGKSCLLHKIYTSLIGNYVPIYLNEGNIIGKNPERAIKAAFEEQYGDRPTSYEKYTQIDRAKKVILLDDLNRIKPKYLQPLEEYLCANFGHVVSIIEPKWKIDMIEVVKEQLDETASIIKLRLLPFYASKRLELIKGLIKTYNGTYEDADQEAENINTFIMDQIKLFSLSPKFINMYVEYCVRDAEMATTSNKNVFGRVFETNLVNNIRRFASEETVDEFSVLLEDVAYAIHFEEKYPLSSTDLSGIIDKYNEDKLMRVSVQKFCEVMVQAKILVEEDNAYYFYNNNYLAYFVAKSLNTRYNNGEGQGELEQISQNICFNINGDILLFLSYITSNIGILRFIKQKAEEHMKDWPEFDIDQKNIGFILKLACPAIPELPSAEDRKKKDERHEKYEKAVTKNDKIERVSLYDYDKSDIETEDYKLGQALRFTELVCKILPGFNHRLKREDKIELSEDIYRFPNRIAFKLLRGIDENFDEIVTVLVNFFKTQDESVTEEKIREAIVRSAETYILNLYNNCARLSVTSKTIEVMNLFPIENTNQRIQHIMMLENLGKFNAFTKEANELYDGTNLLLVKSMIRRIVHKHFLYNRNIRIVGNVESVAKKYFGKSFKKTDLLN